MKAKSLFQRYSFQVVFIISCLLPCFVQSQSEIKINDFFAEYVTGPNGLYDSVSVELTYDLVLYGDEFANVSLVINNAINAADTRFYKSVVGASGDVGNEIFAGMNKTIRWTGPNTLPFDFKLVANVSPEVEVMTALVNQIDSNRMREDLLLIEGIRHRSAGKENLEATQNLIKDRFSSYGFSVIEETFPYNGYDGINIIGSKEGCGRDEDVWLIGGHYDTVNDSPGADDNGSAIVGMLEAARILSQSQFEKRIAFVAWDLEEEGLLGSANFVQRNKDTFGNFKGYLNFEMIGYYSERKNSQTLPTGFDQLFPDAGQTIANDEYRGNFITNVGNTQNSSDLMFAFEAASTIYVPDLKVISVAAPGIGAIVPDLQRSDHTPFWLADIPALMLTDGANFRNENYHGPNDTADSLSFTFMSNVVKAAVATIALDASPTLCYSDSLFVPIILDTKEVYNTSSLKVSPNPANDLLTLSLSDGQFSSSDSVSIVNSSGTIIREEKLNKNNTLEVKDLPTGIYYIVLRTKSDAYTSNFSIQR